MIRMIRINTDWCLNNNNIKSKAECLGLFFKIFKQVTDRYFLLRIRHGIIHMIG